MGENAVAGSNPDAALRQVTRSTAQGAPTAAGNSALTTEFNTVPIPACRKVSFDSLRYRRPDEYRLISERAGSITA